MERDTELIVIFESGNKLFGLELDRVDSIVEKGAVAPVPNAPPAAEGVLFYRDRVLPVFNLLKMLNINSDASGDLMVIVRGLAEDFGISSDRIYAIMPAEQLKIRHIPSEERESHYIQGSGEFKGTEFFLLDFKI